MPLQAPPSKRLPEDRGSLEERGGEEGLDGAVDRACRDHLSRRRRLLRRLSATSIHLSAWKWNSRKFAVASYLSPRLQPLHNSPWCSPLAPKRDELVAVVAPMCIKGLRLVTMQLPEKFSPIGEGTNRSSHIRVSRKSTAA